MRKVFLYDNDFAFVNKVFVLYEWRRKIRILMTVEINYYSLSLLVRTLQSDMSSENLYCAFYKAMYGCFDTIKCSVKLKPSWVSGRRCTPPPHTHTRERETETEWRDTLREREREYERKIQDRFPKYFFLLQILNSDSDRDPAGPMLQGQPVICQKMRGCNRLFPLTVFFPKRCN